MSASLGVARGDIVYGFTANQLISFDSASPGSFTTVGAHGIAASVQVISPTFNPTNGRVYAFGVRPNGGAFDQFLLEFNLATGAGVTVADLGLSTTQAYEALAYSGTLGAMVASQSVAGTFNPTPRLGTLSTTGAFTFLAANGRDNDLATFDASRGRFYTFDVQASPNQAFVVDLVTGGTSAGGVIPQTLGGVAWSATDDAIYGIRTDNAQFIRVASGTTFGETPIGVLSSPLTGIFTIPEPSMLGLIGLGGATAVRRRRRGAGGGGE